jgi:chemotaxis protein CheX
MDVNALVPFLDAVKYTLEQFGIMDIKKGALTKKPSLFTENGVGSIIGITGRLNGNVAYAMSIETAKKLVSTMMMGMPVDAIDEMGKSAIGELSNMITGHASMELSQKGYEVNITPPDVRVQEGGIRGINIIETIAVNLETSVGIVEVNIALNN